MDTPTLFEGNAIIRQIFIINWKQLSHGTNCTKENCLINWGTQWGNCMRINSSFTILM